MRAFIAALICIVSLNAFAAETPNVCPCVPITHLWMVKTCTDWTCASTELAVANGDRQVIAMPVAMNDTRWLIVRRFSADAALDAADDPFRLEQFEHVTDAAVRFSAIGGDHLPMLMTAPDGKVLVLSLRQPEPRRRVVGAR